VALPWVVIFGSMLALGWVLVMRLRGTRVSGGLRIPFGPFLAAGIWGAWLIGP
jgi:prepilin signal peptidase PulO-like enzyme (type II secretory pathway)